MEENKKIKKHIDLGFILLLVGWSISLVLLIVSICFKSSKSNNKKLDLVKESPKMANWYYDSEKNGLLSSNMSQMATYSTYTNERSTTNFILVDTITLNNYFGGDYLHYEVTIDNYASQTGKYYYVALSTIALPNYNQLTSNSQSTQVWTTTSAGRTISYDTNRWSGSSYAYLYLVSFSSSGVVDTNITFRTSNAYTYRSTDSQATIDRLNIWAPYGFFRNTRDLGDEITEMELQKQYNQGFTEGVYQANSIVNTQSVSYNTGYSKGYEEGININDNFTLRGMIYSIVDTPLNILYNFFNFEILGVNLWVFITSILSLLVVIFLVKKFIK